MHRFIVPAHHVIEKIVLYYELRLNSHQIIIVNLVLFYFLYVLSMAT